MRRWQSSPGRSVADRCTEKPQLQSLGWRFRPARRRELEQSIYTFAGLEVKVLHTPGHSEGSVCYFIEDALFSGDTLFNLSIGRTDFPGSSWPQMQQSLEKFKLIEGEYAIYPGHGHSTSLAYEVDNNPYLGEEKWSLY